MADTTTHIPTVEELLRQSAASEGFREALLLFEKNQAASERIHFGAGNPPVKVLRAICALLESQPGLAIDRVEVNGSSGCSDYVGDIRVNGGESTFHFVWDCAWKAAEQGWKDFYGDPDQVRAAKTFGYRCMKSLEPAG